MKTVLSFFRRKPLARTHSLTFNGRTVGRLDDSDGQQIDVCVFQKDCLWRQGNFIIFTSHSAKLTSRYRLNRIWTPSDPGDQHFLYCTYEPTRTP